MINELLCYFLSRRQQFQKPESFQAYIQIPYILWSLNFVGILLYIVEGRQDLVSKDTRESQALIGPFNKIDSNIGLEIMRGLSIARTII